MTWTGKDINPEMGRQRFKNTPMEQINQVDKSWEFVVCATRCEASRMGNAYLLLKAPWKKVRKYHKEQKGQIRIKRIRFMIGTRRGREIFEEECQKMQEDADVLNAWLGGVDTNGQ